MLRNLGSSSFGKRFCPYIIINHKLFRTFALPIVMDNRNFSVCSERKIVK